MTKKRTKSGKRKAAKPKLIKLDIGCGQRKEEGWIGMDRVKTLEADIVRDFLEFPWPFADNSVQEARCLHVLEHIPKEKRFPFFNELWRVLVPDGQCTITTPYYASMRAVQDPTHEWPPIAESSYNYLWKKWRVDNKLDHYLLTCDFDFSWSYTLPGDSEWLARNDETKVFAIRNYFNIVADLQVIVFKRVGR